MFILPELEIYVQPTSFFCDLPYVCSILWMMVVQAIGCARLRDANEGCRARHLLNLLAAIPVGVDARRRRLIDAVLEDFDRLSREP
jgi:hypothetical protein